MCQLQEGDAMVESLANWGEFIGGVAVVISLLYLAIQVRQSVKQAQIDSYLKVTELFTQWTLMVAGNDEASRIFHQGSRDFESLSPEEQTRFNQIISMYFGILDSIFVHELEHLPYPEETLTRTKEAAYGIFLLPGVQSWWQKHRGRMFAPNVERYLVERKERGTGT